MTFDISVTVKASAYSKASLIRIFELACTRFNYVLRGKNNLQNKVLRTDFEETYLCLFEKCKWFTLVWFNLKLCLYSLNSCNENWTQQIVFFIGISVKLSLISKKCDNRVDDLIFSPLPNDGQQAIREPDTCLNIPTRITLQHHIVLHSK